MEIGVFVRETEDWDSLTDEQYIYNLKNSRFNPVLKNILNWNLHFDVGYVEWRSRLKSIAERSWLNAGLKIVKDLNSSWDWLLVTDDDDWFHPRIIEHIFPFFQDTKLVYWDALKYTFTTGEEKLETHKIVDCIASNGCAIKRDCPEKVKNVVLKMSNNLMPALKEYLPSSKKCDEKLSMWLRHPGSYWRLLNYDFPFNFSLKIDPSIDAEGFNDYVYESRKLASKLTNKYNVKFI